MLQWSFITHISCFFISLPAGKLSLHELVLAGIRSFLVVFVLIHLSFLMWFGFTLLWVFVKGKRAWLFCDTLKFHHSHYQGQWIFFSLARFQDVKLIRLILIKLTGFFLVDIFIDIFLKFWNVFYTIFYMKFTT